jgi:hypothetical protein
MRIRGINKVQLLSNPTCIAPPSYSTGLFSSKILNLREIEAGLKKTFDAMSDFSKQLLPGESKNDLFVGVGIVVLQTQKQ